MLRKILLVALGIVLVLVGLAVWQIGPRNILGLLRYDRRREGALAVGDPAPDVVLGTLDGAESSLLEHLDAGAGPRPLVVVFGSYT